MRKLICGRALLTGRSDIPEIHNGGLLVENGKIIAVDTVDNLRATYPKEDIGEQIGGNEYIVMPGLVNSHFHRDGTSWVYLGGRDCTVDKWMMRESSLLQTDLDLETQYLAAQFIENGITTAMSSNHPLGRYQFRYGQDPDPFDDPVIRSFDKAGIRLAFAVGVCQTNWFTFEQDEEFLNWLPKELAEVGREIAVTAEIDDVISAMMTFRETATSDKLRFLLGGSGPKFMKNESTERIAEVIVPEGIGYHAHFYSYPGDDEYWKERVGKSGFEWLDDLGLLRPGTSFCHNLSATPDDYALMAERGAMSVVAGSCNVRGGIGIAPVGMMRSLGLKLGIATDDLAINADHDLLQELRLSTVIPRPFDNADFVPAEECIEMVTSWGSEITTYDDLTGTLEPGKRADIVLLDADRVSEPGMHPDISIAEAVYERGRGRDVITVLVDGEPVYKDRKHLTLDRDVIVQQLRENIEFLSKDPAAIREVNKMKEFAAKHVEFLQKCEAA